MSHSSYEEGKKQVYRGLILLGVVTLVEVFFSLLGKGHIIGGTKGIVWLTYLIGTIIIVLSIYKAYYIIYQFMHMGYEVRGLALSVLLPMVLLVWAIIAFFMEGDYWRKSRMEIEEKNRKPLEQSGKQQTSYLLDEYTFHWKG